jgi:predicted nucleotidyltransferase
VSSSIDIRPIDRKIVETVLLEHLPHDASVWVFGSRAHGPAKKASDLDLLIDAGRRLTHAESLALESAFEESDLPYSVDLVDVHVVDGYFLETILRNRASFFTDPC